MLNKKNAKELLKEHKKMQKSVQTNDVTMNRYASDETIQYAEPIRDRSRLKKANQNT